MQESLVNIFEVLELHKIPDADAIELAIVNGWQCVVGKGSVKVGQKVTFISPDSLLAKEVMETSFPNLKLSPDKEGWSRIKTIRLRGQISQGLVHPDCNVAKVLLSDKDEKLIKKYSTSSNAGFKAANARGSLPFGISKTDQENYQSLSKRSRPSLLDKLKAKLVKFFGGYIARPRGFIDTDALYLATLKMDGSSMTVCSRANIYGVVETHVCSRNLSLRLEEPSSFVDEAKKTQTCGGSLIGWVEDQAKKNPGFTVVVRGELVGPGIQKNPTKLNALQFFEFEAYLDNAGIRSSITTPFQKVNSVLVSLSPWPNTEDWDNKCKMIVESSLLPEGCELKDVEGLVFWKTTKDSYGGVSSFKYVFPEYLCRLK